MTGTETNRAATAPCKFFTPPVQSGKRRARTARRGQAASAARPSALFPLDSHLSYTRRTRGGRGCQAGQDWPRSEKIPAPADPPARREFSHSLTASHLPSRCTEEQPESQIEGYEAPGSPWLGRWHRGNFGSGLVARSAGRSCRTNTFRSRRKVREMCPSGTSARFTEWCTNSGSPFRFAISCT